MPHISLEIQFNSNENKENYKQTVTESVLFYGLVFDKENGASIFYKIPSDSDFSAYYIFAKALKFLADFKWFDEKVDAVIIKK